MRARRRFAFPRLDGPINPKRRVNTTPLQMRASEPMLERIRAADAAAGGTLVTYFSMEEEVPLLLCCCCCRRSRPPLLLFSTQEPDFSRVILSAILGRLRAAKQAETTAEPAAKPAETPASTRASEPPPSKPTLFQRMSTEVNLDPTSLAAKEKDLARKAEIRVLRCASVSGGPSVSGRPPSGGLTSYSVRIYPRLAITWDRRDLVGTILANYETPPANLMLQGLQQA